MNEIEEEEPHGNSNRRIEGNGVNVNAKSNAGVFVLSFLVIPTGSHYRELLVSDMVPRYCGKICPLAL